MRYASCGCGSIHCYTPDGCDIPKKECPRCKTGLIEGPPPETPPAHSTLEDNFWVALLRPSVGVFVMCNDDFSIAAFKTERDALNFFESTYHEAHGRSYERSMSACVNFITYNPIVLNVNFEKLKELALTNEEGKFTPVSLSNVSGFAKGIQLRACPELEEMIGRGVVPNLVAT